MPSLRAPLLLLAVVATALSAGAQVAVRSESSTLASAAQPAGEIEPAYLPGNVPPVEDFMLAYEPPLPEPDGSQVTIPMEQNPAEVASVPRRFRYTLSLDVRGVYDDNVTLSSGANRQKDFYTSVNPQLTAGIGDVLGRQENYISLHYSPSGYVFFDDRGLSSIDQVGSLEGQWRIRRVTLSLSQSFSSVQSSNLNLANPEGGFSNQTNLDVGGRSRVNTYSAYLSAAAPLAGKTSLRGSVNYSVSAPEGLIGSETLTGTVGVDYQYGPKLSLGLGLSGGQQFVDNPNPDTTFEQLNARFSYQATGKISASGSVGVEFRQSQNGSQDHVAPVFQLGVAYAPFDATQIDFSATGRTQNSASASAQDFTSTQVTLTFRQRFLQRIFANLSIGLQNQNYFSTTTGNSATRDDNYYFIASGIDVRLTGYWFAGVFYVHRANDSTLPTYTFDNNQYGIRTNVSF